MLLKKDYPVKGKSFVVGFLFVVVASGLYYFLFDLWVIRWFIAIIVGLYEIIRIKKRKSIF